MDELEQAQFVDEFANPWQSDEERGKRTVERAIQDNARELDLDPDTALALARADTKHYYAVLDQGIARKHGYTLDGEAIEYIQIDYFARDWPDECVCGLSLEEWPDAADRCPGCGIESWTLRAEHCTEGNCESVIDSGGGYYIGDDGRAVCNAHVNEY